MSFYSGNEFKRTKRFGHIIIRSQGHPCNFIRFLVLRCQHDNGVCVFFPDFLAEGKSAYIGKHNIKNCKVKFFLLNTSQSVLCRVKFIYNVILVLQIDFKKICNIVFIVNNKNFFVHPVLSILFIFIN